MASDLREKVWQGAGMVLGAAASWPSVSKYLGVLPDLIQAEMWGTVVGFIFGLTLFATEIVLRLASPWHNALKVFAFLLVAGLWLYLNWKLPQFYEAAIEAPNITPERVNAAKWAVMGLSFLWSAPLTYVGGVLGDKAAAKFKKN